MTHNVDPNGPFLKREGNEWILEDSQGNEIDRDENLGELKRRNGL